MAEPTFLSDGTTLRRTDTIWSIEQKWLGALLNGGCAGCGGGPSVETFHILTELGDNIATEGADLLEQEAGP